MAEEKQTFVSWSLTDLFAEKEFPGPIYLCIHHKLVKFKDKGDLLESEGFNKLVYNHVKYLFIEEGDRESFKKWVRESKSEDHAHVEAVAEHVNEAVAEHVNEAIAEHVNEAVAEHVNEAKAAPPKSQKVVEPVKVAPKQEKIPPDAKPILDATQEQRRAMLDLFESPKDDEQVKVAVESSKRLVTEFLKKPYAINNVQLLQRYSKGCMDHSVNVSVLSTFLGVRMGYTHQLILENLSLGGLFHDVGKALIKPTGEQLIGDDDPAMREHPKLGKAFLEKSKDRIPNEVLMIVAQHHECLDGSGYPAGIKGLAMYDLARVVAIANLYDNLVSQSKAEQVKDRALEALNRLEKEFEGRLDPKKLEKIVKIIRYGLI